MVCQLILSIKRYLNKRKNPHLFEENKKSLTDKISVKFVSLTRDKSEEIARSIDGAKLPENPEERARAIYDL
jgi:hypothetical protein